MAFDVKRINPLDLTPRKAVGIDIPLSGQAVFNQTFETKDAIKANLINYFLTNKGERFLNPEFGSNIRRLLFENITEENLAEIEAVVADDLEKYFPRVRPTVIELASNPDTNTIVFFLRYAIIDTNIEDELIINFDE
jgi:uncharacterized protein